MQITLNQDEIEDAVRCYFASQISLHGGQDVTVDLKAGRGENGFTATLDIQPQTVATKPANPVGTCTPVQDSSSDSTSEPEPGEDPAPVLDETAGDEGPVESTPRPPKQGSIFTFANTRQPAE